MTEKPKFTIGAFGMIFDDQGRILLCHRRDKDMWNLPGGVVNAGESPWDAVIREVKEETGLDVTIIDLIGVYAKTYNDDIVFSFTCKIIGGEIHLTDEADKIEYFAVDAIPENTLPKQPPRIREATNWQGKILTVTQPE